MNFWQATSQGIVWVTETLPEEVGGTKLGCRRAEENWRDQVNKRKGTFRGRLREEVKQKMRKSSARRAGPWNWSMMGETSRKSQLGLGFVCKYFSQCWFSACFIFQTETGVLIQLRQRNWCRERDAEAWDDTETEPFWTWRSYSALLCCSQPLDKRTTPGVK